MIALPTIRPVAVPLKRMRGNPCALPRRTAEKSWEKMHNVYYDPIADFFIFRIRMTRTYKPPQLFIFYNPGMNHGMGVNTCSTGIGITNNECRNGGVPGSGINTRCQTGCGAYATSGNCKSGVLPSNSYIQCCTGSGPSSPGCITGNAANTGCATGNTPSCTLCLCAAGTQHWS
jgi:hypothetical protein